MVRIDIEIKKLKKSYDGKTALNGIDLEIYNAEMFGLIGPDGAGKTTLMRVLCGLVDIDEGECRVKGRDVVKEFRKVRSIIGYMPQRFSLYPDLTVSENLRFFAELFQVPQEEREKKLKQLLDFSRLSPFQKRRASELSGGMKQKLALSCALIHTPEVLLLDEPTTGVDPVSRREFWMILKELKQEGVTIMVSTPYMDEAELCDRVALIHKGNILAVSEPEKIPLLFEFKLIEVRGPELIKMNKSLEDLPCVLDSQLFGDKLHLSVYEVSESKKAIEKKLFDSGFDNFSVEEVSPSFEDSFVALMRKEGKSD